MRAAFSVVLALFDCLRGGQFIVINPIFMNNFM
jgi:hypothetical protein